MLRWFGLAAMGLFAAFSCCAQADPVQITVVATATNGKQIELKNLSAQPITAFGLEFRQHPATGGPDSTTTFLYDSILNGPGQPGIAPGQSASQAFGGDGTLVATGAKIPMVSTLEFKSALFQNGASFGDSAWTLKLVEQRSLTSQFVAQALSIFEANPPVATAALLEKLRELDAAARANPDRTQSAIARSLYETVYGNIEADSRPGSVAHQMQLLKERQAALLASFGGR